MEVWGCGRGSGSEGLGWGVDRWLGGGKELSEGSREDIPGGRPRRNVHGSADLFSCVLLKVATIPVQVKAFRKVLSW